MYSLNHNCHQLTIYENIIKIDDHLTLARPLIITEIQSELDVLYCGLIYLHQN